MVLALSQCNFNSYAADHRKVFGDSHLTVKGIFFISQTLIIDLLLLVPLPLVQEDQLGVEEQSFDPGGGFDDR